MVDHKTGAKNDPHPHFGQTALQAAVSAGHASCVQCILEAAAPSGSDSVIANHEDPNGEAPIHVAARCGNEEILTVSYALPQEVITLTSLPCSFAALLVASCLSWGRS